MCIINLRSHAPKIDELKVNIWLVRLWNFKNNKNTGKVKISSVYGKDAITDYLVWNLFSKFNSGNISLRDEPRPADLIQDSLKELV